MIPVGVVIVVSAWSQQLLPGGGGYCSGGAEGVDTCDTSRFVSQWFLNYYYQHNYENYEYI
jgi:hypothetical protein